MCVCLVLLCVCVCGGGCSHIEQFTEIQLHPVLRSRSRAVEGKQRSIRGALCTIEQMCNSSRASSVLSLCSQRGVWFHYNQYLLPRGSLGHKTHTEPSPPSDRGKTQHNISSVASCIHWKKTCCFVLKIGLSKNRLLSHVSRTSRFFIVLLVFFSAISTAYWKTCYRFRRKSVFKSQRRCCLGLLVHAKATAARLLVLPDILLFLRHKKRGNWGFFWGLAGPAVSGNPA